MAKNDFEAILMDVDQRSEPVSLVPALALRRTLPDKTDRLARKSTTPWIASGTRHQTTSIVPA